MEPAVQAAQAFNRFARAHLRASERPSSQAAVARLIGEANGNYSAALRGVRGGSLDRVQRWLQAWAEAGEPELVLVLGAAGATVVLREEVERTAGVVRDGLKQPGPEASP